MNNYNWNVKTNNGAPGSSAQSNQTMTSWNSTGSSGSSRATGAFGAFGASGASGAIGAAGASGASGSSEMSERERRNEATRRHRERERIYALSVKADTVNLEEQKRELEKKLEYERGRTEAMSNQINAMSNVFPNYSNNPDTQAATQHLSQASYWTQSSTGMGQNPPLNQQTGSQQVSHWTQSTGYGQNPPSNQQSSSQVSWPGQNPQPNQQTSGSNNYSWTKK